MALVLYVPYNNLFINHTIPPLKNSKMQIWFHITSLQIDIISRATSNAVHLLSCHTQRQNYASEQVCNELFNANVSLSDTMDIALALETPKGRNK